MQFFAGRDRRCLRVVRGMPLPTTTMHHTVGRLGGASVRAPSSSHLPSRAATSTASAAPHTSDCSTSYSSSAFSSSGRSRASSLAHTRTGPFAGLNRHRVERLVQQSLSGACSPAHWMSAAASSPRGGSSSSFVCGAALADAPSSSAQQVLKVVQVELGDARSYPIYIGTGLLEGQGELLRKHIPSKRVLIVTNETIAPLYLDKTVKALTADGRISVETVVLPDGEEFKSMDVLAQVWDKALQSRLDRGTTFLALGGGVIGDMTGFAAACYQRGVHFVQVPTTVMSQVDSSVGGKTGVNHPLGKNMIGAFYQPRCVLCDIDTLGTLPDRELASGISEIIKYGLIRDAPLFAWLEANMARLLARDAEAIAYAVERSCVNKAEVVAADERETNDVRATLNLGHTFGHAIETGTGYGTLLHGEAVAIGMVMAADLSHRMGWIDQALVDRIRNLLVAARLPVVPPAPMTPALFRQLMAVDKKVAAGKLRLILLRGPLGSCVVTGDFDPAKLDETLEAFCPKA